MLVLGCFAEFKLHIKLKLAEVIRELSFVFDRLNNKIYRSCNMIVAVLLMDDDLIKWSKMKLNRRERTSPSVLTWVITFPLDTGWISFISFFFTIFDPPPLLCLPSSNEIYACALFPFFICWSPAVAQFVYRIRLSR